MQITIKLVSYTCLIVTATAFITVSIAAHSVNSDVDEVIKIYVAGVVSGILLMATLLFFGLVLLIRILVLLVKYFEQLKKNGHLKGGQ